jgi:2-dehydro-3-deoxyphosphooctonate aldolase (KDO 8-P synthase)
MRSLPIMRSIGYPVVLDATHSVQLPSAGGGMSGGQPEFIFPIARAGAAVGIDALFVETHPEPAKALSDAASQLPLDQLDALLTQVMAIDAIMIQHK